MMRKVKENVVYSKEFRELVLKAHPRDPEIRRRLDNNDYVLGRFLDDGCCGNGKISVSVDEIIVTIGLGQQDDFMLALLARANVEKLRALAYKRWGEERFYDED